MDEITPEFVIQHLAANGCLNVSQLEAIELVPLVQAQRAALLRLHTFDVFSIRTPSWFDPREGYAE